MASVNLNIGGTTTRVACPPPVARRLRKGLREHLVAEEAPLGFLVQPSRLPWRGHALVDRCGFVLGSAGSVGALTAMLGDHLTALLPPKPSTVRFRVRAVLGPEGATLCMYPVLFLPPLRARELRAIGHAVIDRLAIDVDSETRTLNHTPAPWDDLRHGRWTAGHSRTWGGERITRIIATGTESTGAAAIACRLAQTAMSGSRSEILDVAQHLATEASVVRMHVSSLHDLPAALAPN
jgi:hypothetical protein